MACYYTLGSCCTRGQLRETLDFFTNDVDATFVGSVQFENSFAKHISDENIQKYSHARLYKGMASGKDSQNGSSHPNNSLEAARIVDVFPVPGGP